MLFHAAAILLGLMGGVSLLLTLSVMAFPVLGDLNRLEYRVSAFGSLVRNILMLASAYSAFNMPGLAAFLAWSSLAVYVSLAVGWAWFKHGYFHFGGLIPTFYATSGFIALCALTLSLGDKTTG